MRYVASWEREAMKQGMQQGIQQGMQKNKLNIAKKMKQENMDIELIAKITGLSKKEILAL